MACFKPVKAFKCADGSVVFTELKRNGDIIGDIRLPCGQCVGCRIDRSREWSLRCMHEAAMHDQNSYITLTYADEHWPKDGSLDYTDFQKFMRRLRKKVGPVRFFMCGEYGEGERKHPHFHALLFGYQFPDLKFWKNSPGGYPTYRSALLESLWPVGFSIIGSVTRESAGYVARYCMKKVTGDLAEAHYGGRTPEFARMSLKPGIGAEFFEKFESDVLPVDYVIVDGYKMPVPRYYEKLYKGDLDEIKFRREQFAKRHADNNTEERLAVRKEVLEAKLRQLKRDAI